MEYDNTNSGVLFKNEKKDKESHPDYKGNVDINGTKLDIAAWIKTSQKTGKKFMSLKFSEPFKKAEQVLQPPKQPSLPTETDEVPF